MIKSINTDNNQIILDILELHVPSKKIDADITFSRGVFYKSGAIQKPKYKFDLFPQTQDTVKASSEAIPLQENTLDCIMYDPPFLPGATKVKTGIIANRFGWFRTVKDLWVYYQATLKECHRVLKDKGILIVKCQDVTNCGKQWWSHIYLVNEAEKIGFYTKDLFVLLAKNRLTDPRWKTQRHGRKFHCYYLVFQKLDK
jgi:hypothetical protein